MKRRSIKTILVMHRYGRIYIVFSPYSYSHYPYPFTFIFLSCSEEIFVWIFLKFHFLREIFFVFVKWVERGSITKELLNYSNCTLIISITRRRRRDAMMMQRMTGSHLIHCIRHFYAHLESALQAAILRDSLERQLIAKHTFSQKRGTHGGTTIQMAPALLNERTI